MIHHFTFNHNQNKKINDETNKTNEKKKEIDDSYYFKTSLYLGILGGIIFIGTLAFFFEHYDEFNLLKDYKKTDCEITGVEFPTSLRSPQNMDLWFSCDCGKYCESYYPCLNLYTNLSSNHLINNFEETDSSCTYFSKECRDFENPFTVWKTLNETIKRGKNLNNTKIDCFVHNTQPEENPIYISLNEDQTKLITCVVFLGIGLLLLLMCLVYFTIGLYPQKNGVCCYYLENGCCCCRRCSKNKENTGDSGKSNNSSKSNNRVYIEHIAFN